MFSITICTHNRCLLLKRMIASIENQTFERLPDSSYYRISDGFPIPTCTRKMMEEIYHNNIND